MRMLSMNKEYIRKGQCWKWKLAFKMSHLDILEAIAKTSGTLGSDRLESMLLSFNIAFITLLKGPSSVHVCTIAMS